MLDVSKGSAERGASDIATMEESIYVMHTLHATFRLSYAVSRVSIVAVDTELGHALLELLEIRRDTLRNVFEIDAQARAMLPNSASKKINTLEASDNNNYYIAPLACDTHSNQSDVENIY